MDEQLIQWLRYMAKTERRTMTMNEISNAMRAKLLTAAVPYIKEYTNTYVVVKYGGNAMIDAEIKHSVMQDLLLLSLVGDKVVLLHGG